MSNDIVYFDIAQYGSIFFRFDRHVLVTKTIPKRVTPPFDCAVGEGCSPTVIGGVCRCESIFAFDSDGTLESFLELNCCFGVRSNHNNPTVWHLGSMCTYSIRKIVSESKRHRAYVWMLTSAERLSHPIPIKDMHGAPEWRYLPSSLMREEHP